jgi:hypothetical protein
LDLTRKKAGKKPFFTPSFAGTGQGSKTFYSFQDLMLLGVVIWARKMGIQRKWIEHFITAGKRLGEISNSARNPLSPYYKVSESVKNGHYKTEGEYVVEITEADNAFLITYKVTKKTEDQFNANDSFDYIPLEGNPKKDIDQEQYQLARKTSILTVSISFSKLNLKLRENAKNAGISI